MKRVVFIMPGYGESVNQGPYKKIANWFKLKGITPILVNVHWKHRTHLDYVADFMKIYDVHKTDKVYLLGFSFGAMIAFIASTKIKVETQILCSLSPYFKEDIRYIPKSYRKWAGQKRMYVIRKLSFNKLAFQTKTKKTILVLGAKEIKIVSRRVQDAHKKIKYSVLKIINNAEHKIGQKEYLQALHSIINSLS